MAVGPLDGAQDVRAVAGTADGDEQIAWVGQVLQLFEKTRSKPSSLPQARMYGVLSVKLRMRMRFLASLSKSSRVIVPLPRSSQKCEALEPLPPLPMT